MKQLLSEIYVYPVKSLAGIRLHSSLLGGRGLEYDRRWMIVDAGGRFLSQRDHPTMALIGTAIQQNQLLLFDRRNPEDCIGISLGWTERPTEKVRVQIWSSSVKAMRQEEEADKWLSAHIGHSVRLVQIPDTAKRSVDRRYVPSGHYVRFADAFPFLLVGTASLQELNSKLEIPIGMDRFRPNLVIQNEQPFEEDNWEEIQIGGHVFRAVKHCARCVMVTIDQLSLEKHPEPLKALSQFRKKGNKVLFGQYLIWTGEDCAVPVSTGSFVEVLSRKS